MSLRATEWKGKSGRRHLKDYSNDIAYRSRRFSSKSVNGRPKFLAKSEVDDEPRCFRVNDVSLLKEEEEKERDSGSNDGVPDQLFLVHSGLSTLLRQIDELVVQAADLKARGNNGISEIESFTSFLSDMLSSLKPWVPRLHKAISNAPLQAENLEEPFFMSTTSLCTSEEQVFKVESPEHTKFESLVSLSPLVSWRGDLDTDKSRQLFLLTPIVTGRSKSSKHQDLFKPAFEKIISKPLDVSKEKNAGLIGGDAMKVAAHSNTPGPVRAVTKSKVECASAFSPVFRKKAQSELLMTPCLKLSPPKSCALLEPASGSCCQGKQGASKSTLFPIGNSDISGSQIYASSCTGNSGSLAMKYPELLGIQNAPVNVKTDLEASPDWSFSPPKTCVLLETLDENAADKGAYAVPDKREVCLGETKKVKDSNPEHEGGSLRMVERIPMWKEAERVMEKSRGAGESTLKRELWTRFEAASTHGLRYSSTALRGTSKKGFLEMLEEASGDEDELR